MWSILEALRNDPKRLKDNLARRGLDASLVDEATALDADWRKKLQEVNALKHKRNQLTKKIGKAAADEKKQLIEQAKQLGKEIERLEQESKELLAKRDKILLDLPNIIHETVPIGKDDTENVPLRFYGKMRINQANEKEFVENVAKPHHVEYEVSNYPLKSHIDLIEPQGFADTERAAKVAGSRFFYLFNDLLWLEYALIGYSINFLQKEGFTLTEPPFMMNRAAYEGVTAVQDFIDALYKIEQEDLFLIATSEHPIAAMFKDETLEISQLPIKIAGFSPCFRKEAGAHGRDTKGIFRVHQFYKIEQFIFCLPEESWKWHEYLIQNAEKLWQGLEIPYRVVNICTGDLGVVAAKKYDIEAWMPGQGKFREVVSCSNCTDWQSYRLNIRYAEKKGHPSKGFVHTLNSTAIATTRALIAIFENYQQEDGSIIIPKVLRPFLEPFDSAPKEVITPRKPF